MVLKAAADDACVSNGVCFEELMHVTENSVAERGWEKYTENSRNPNGETRMLRGRRLAKICAEKTDGDAVLCLFLEKKNRRLNTDEESAQYQELLEEVENPCWGSSGDAADAALKGFINKQLAGRPTSNIRFQVQQCKC